MPDTSNRLLPGLLGAVFFIFGTIMISHVYRFRDVQSDLILVTASVAFMCGLVLIVASVRKTEEYR